jgi:glycosyltransferase involved in cell wall biosynthesis
MNVLVLTPYFPLPQNPVMGIWGLLQAQALMRQGCEVTVVAPIAWIPRSAARLPFLTRSRRIESRATCPSAHRWGALRVHYPRWPIYHVGPHREYMYRHPRLEARVGWVRLRAWLERFASTEQPDVVYAHGTGLCGYLAMKLGRLSGIPFVTIDHDFAEISDCARFPARRAHYREVAGEASMLIAVSKRMEHDMRRVLGPHRMTILPGAAADPDGGPSAAGRRDRDGEVVIFSAGGFYPRKGFPLLVEAFGQVAADHPGAVLRIAGDGQDRAAVERAIRQADLGDRIELLGFLPHEQVLRETASCDIFALVGWDEPMPAVFMEALAAGKPLVWASDGGINDFVEDGVHGLSVTPRDAKDAAAALDRLLADPNQRLRMGEAGRALHRARLTWDANAGQLAELLGEAVSGSTRS